MKNLELNQMGLEPLTSNEAKKQEGGFCINFFGIFRVCGILDGIRGNTTFEWA